MNNHSFGPTRCGAILEQLISGDKKVLRKVRAFYSESMKVFSSLANIPEVRLRRALRDAYVFHRYDQFIDDVDLGDFDSSVRAEIDQRMEYLLKHGSRKYVK